MRVLGILIPLLIIFGSAYAAYPYLLPYLTPPCTEPITYHLSAYDRRFGVSEETLNASLREAAAVWNEAAGKTLVMAGEDGIAVELLYGEAQQTSDLGERIDTDQEAYDAKRAEVEALKGEYEEAKLTYERLAASFKRQEQAYAAKVEYWNERGGAPPPEYQALQKERAELKRAEEEVNAQVPVVNGLAEELNQRVEELNGLASVINGKVNTYNEHADDDYDQGKFVRDETGEHIYVYEFSDRQELTRVFAHEFGHALGMEHVENPESIMFAYDIGEGIEPTPEDKAELARVCALD